MSNFGDVLRELLQTKRITDEGLGAESPVGGSFRGLGANPTAAGQFFEIKSDFNAIGSHFASVQSHLKELDFNIWKPI